MTPSRFCSLLTDSTGVYLVVFVEGQDRAVKIPLEQDQVVTLAKNLIDTIFQLRHRWVAADRERSS